MKKVLLQAFLSTIILISTLLPKKTMAQCSCSGGSPANQLSYTVTLASTNQSNTTITFPTFDPAVGTLACVRLDDTVSIVSSTGIRNYDALATEYEFQLTVNTMVSGPSLSRTNFKNTQYGPDILEAFGSAGDSINYGPDTIYNNWPSTRTNTTNMTPYLGAGGTVDFTYTIGGGVIAVGGANYNAQVRTTTWGVFKLTYFWCPSEVLASGLRNFSVKNAGQTVHLEWQAPENAQTDNFKIETSTDGQSFENLKPGTGANVVKVASAKYMYQYRPDRPIDRKLYFRVRYEHDGQLAYSEMKWLLPENSGRPLLSVYPNPVVRTLRLAIGEAVSGEVDVEVSNQLGQVVLRKKQLAGQNNLIEIPVSDPPPPGIYFVKARVNSTGKVYSGKLLFSR